MASLLSFAIVAVVADAVVAAAVAVAVVVAVVVSQLPRMKSVSESALFQTKQ